ncbi:MAG: hypothetical protein OCD01_02555 [Fibrobacterales bacterium]
MKEYKEQIIPLPYDGDPDLIVEVIDTAAQKLYNEGWYFIESRTDELVNNITLFFERDVELK